MERTTRRQSNTRHSHPTDASLWFLPLLLLITACTRTASLSPTLPTTESVPFITINQVQVTQGSGIYISGAASIAVGDCVQTELLENGQPVEWWPKDTCVEVGSGQWELLTALGRDGSPGLLDPSAEYEIHAWSRDLPEAVTTRFPFDLEGPPQP